MNLHEIICPYCGARGVAIQYGSMKDFKCLVCGTEFDACVINVIKRKQKLKQDLQKESYKPITREDIDDELIDLEFHNREARRKLRESKRKKGAK